MDNTADMLARIRNALSAKKDIVNVVSSKKNKAILDVLKNEGYIENFEEVEIRTGVKELKVILKYKKGMPAIRHIKLRSKQQRREYSSVADLPLVFNGLGTSIISTSLGIMSDAKAREKHVGGEVICEIF